VTGRPHRRAIWFGTAVVAVLALSACASPARTDGQYRMKAQASVEADTSNVATAILVLDQRLRGRVVTTYADVVVTSSETSAESISDGFGSVQPPDSRTADQGSAGAPARSDLLRDDVGDLLSAAAEALGHARVAVRRSDREAIRAALAELRSSQAALARAQEQLS
jgi:hypothetical protein